MRKTSIRAVEYYSVGKKHEKPPCAATRMELETITGSEVSQAKAGSQGNTQHDANKLSRGTDAGNRFPVTKEGRGGGLI